MLVGRARTTQSTVPAERGSRPAWPGHALARIPKQRMGTWLGAQANWKRRGRFPHQGIFRSGSWAVRMIGL